MSCNECPNDDCPRSDAQKDAARVRAAAKTLRRARHALQTNAVDKALITQVDAQSKTFVHRKAPKRLLIELLLERGELTRAERELAQALLAWPKDRVLVRLRCQWLVLMTEFRAAVNEWHDWITHRPWDGIAHDLAGEAAAMDGDHELAAGHFALAAAHAKRRTRRRWLLARAHIESQQFVAAEQWIADIGRPCPRLEGLLAARQGQLLEASDLLAQAAANQNTGSFQQQIIARELLDVRRQLGRPTAVRSAVDRLTLQQPLAWAAASETLLGIGQTTHASLMAARLLKQCRKHALAGHVLVVSMALDGRTAASRRTLGRMNRLNVELNTAVMARLWRNGLLSQIVSQQRDARRSGADPSAHRLQPLLERADRVLATKLRDSNADLDDAQTRRLVQLRSTCQTALGQPLEAMRSLDNLNQDHPIRVAA